MASQEPVEASSLAGDSSSDEEADSDAQSACSSQGSEDSAKSDASGAASKKKKKKKKNKKKKSGNAADGNGLASGPPGPPISPPISKEAKGEAEKRFNSAMAVIKGNDEMWLDLKGTLLVDNKAKKLVELLKSNSSLTDVNLSKNLLTDETAAAIASTLAVSSCAPELIQLDLRENNFSELGLTQLKGLAKMRKDLNIQTGVIEELPPPAPPAQAKGKGDGSGAGNKAAGGASEVTQGPMFRKYFQSPGTADEEDSSMQESNPESPSIDAAELWGKLTSLSSELPGSIAALQEPLRQLCASLHRELVMLSVDTNPQDGSCPHVKAALEGLPLLSKLLQCEPRPLVMQYSTAVQPSVGSHRVWASEAVVLLVQPHNAVIDAAVAAAQLVPRILALAMQRPLCSTLHCRALRLLKAVVGSRQPTLLAPLFTAGWGLQLPQQTLQQPQLGSAAGETEQHQQQQQPPASAVGADKAGAAAGSEAGPGQESKPGSTPEQQGEEPSTGSTGASTAGETAPTASGNGTPAASLLAPLPEVLASLGAAATSYASGKRSHLAGFLIEASKVLVHCSEPDADDTSSDSDDDTDSIDAAPRVKKPVVAPAGAGSCRDLAARALLSSKVWSEFVDKESGAFKALCTEQEGDLGGPRAQRGMGLLDAHGSELADLTSDALGGLGEINGQDVLAMLGNLAARS